ncbi:FCD domain-containing protein [Bradyrhizobium jicamae]|uniref:FCD domain-containing protein n=1 Tax=Bradyrhizobium jicamae TaxID=280332 RepID=UPI001BACB266|nr:FCD domain-containing protein [Bradyrhizobium jicamae]
MPRLACHLWERILNIHLKKPRKAEPGDEAPASSGGQDLLARLRDDIVRHTFAPETKLKFADLTERYGLGIGTLREALSQLVSEGFVTLEAGKGFRVAPVSRSDLIEVTDHYVGFETRALSSSIGRGDDEWETNVVASFHRLGIIEDLSWQERMRRHGDWVERHRQFHEALVAACSDRWLLRLRSLMFYQLERYRFLSKMNREKSQTRKGTEHRAIMDATLARDPQKAATLLERHIRETSESILGTLA